jgi:hypothetical protein
MLGGKAGYTNLLSLIRHARPQLYDLIQDLCLDRLFRAEKYVNTFLLPSVKLVESLVARVDKDEDFAVAEEIRSLLLSDLLEKADFKKGALITTMRSGYILADPVAVGKLIENPSANTALTILSRHSNKKVTRVYNYLGDSTPEIKFKEGMSGGFILVGGADSEPTAATRALVIRITKSLVSEKNAVQTMENFRTAVAAVICNLQHHDASRYQRAKFYLASNPILTWHFLVMGGSRNALVTPSELKELEPMLLKACDTQKTLSDVETSGYKMDKALLKYIKEQRMSLIDKNDRSTMIASIHNAYREFLKKAEGHSIDTALTNNIDLKLLMDELRFMYDGAVRNWEEVDYALSALEVINWDFPKSNLVICNQSTYESLKSVGRCTEAFMSGPVTFVKSIYFMSIPLEEDVYKQLAGTKGGGSIQGGNPANISSVVFTGGAARASCNSDTNLASFVRVLSTSQREALRQLL